MLNALNRKLNQIVQQYQAELISEEEMSASIHKIMEKMPRFEGASDPPDIFFDDR